MRLYIGLFAPILSSFLCIIITSEETFKVLKQSFNLNTQINFYKRTFSNVTVSKNGAIFFGLSDHDEVSGYFHLPVPSSDPPMISVYHAPVMLAIGHVNVRHLSSDFQSNRQIMQKIFDIRHNLADCPSEWMPLEVILIKWSNLCSKAAFNNRDYSDINTFEAGLFWSRDRTYLVTSYLVMKNSLNDEGPSNKIGFNIGMNMGWLESGLSGQRLTNNSKAFYYRLDVDNTINTSHGGCTLGRESGQNDGFCDKKPIDFTPYPRRLSQFGSQQIILQNAPCYLKDSHVNVFCNFRRRTTVSIKDKETFQRKYQTPIYELTSNKASFMACSTPRFLETGEYWLTLSDSNETDCLFGDQYVSTVVITAQEDKDSVPKIIVSQTADDGSEKGSAIDLSKPDGVHVKIEHSDFHITELANELNFSIHSPDNLEVVFTTDVYKRNMVMLDVYTLKNSIQCVRGDRVCANFTVGYASIKDTKYNATIWSDMILVMPAPREALAHEALLQPQNDSFCQTNQFRSLINSESRSNWLYKLNNMNCPCSLNHAKNDVLDFYPTSYCPLTMDRTCSQDQECFNGRSNNLGILCCYLKVNGNLLHTHELDSLELRQKLQPSIVINDQSNSYHQTTYQQLWRSLVWPHYKCCLLDESPRTIDNCERFWLSEDQYITCSSYVPKTSALVYGNGHVVTFRQPSETCIHEDCLERNDKFTLNRIGDFLILADPQVQVRFTYLTSFPTITGLAWRNDNDGSICEIALVQMKEITCTCNSIIVHNELNDDYKSIVHLKERRIDPRKSLTPEYWIRFHDKSIGMMISSYTVMNEKRIIIQISREVKYFRSPLTNSNSIMYGLLEVPQLDNQLETLSDAFLNNFTVASDKSYFKRKIDYNSLRFLYQDTKQHETTASDLRKCNGLSFCLEDLKISQSEANMTRDVGEHLMHYSHLGSIKYDVCDAPNLLGLSTSISQSNRTVGSQLHFHGCELTDYRLELLRANNLNIDSEISFNGNRKIWMPKNFTGDNHVTCTRNSNHKQDWSPRNAIDKWQALCQGDRIVQMKMFDFFGGFAYWMIIVLFALGLLIVVLLSALVMGFIKPPFNKKLAQKASKIQQNLTTLPTCFSTDSSAYTYEKKRKDLAFDNATGHYYTHNLRYVNGVKFSPQIKNSPVKSASGPYIVPGVIYKGNLTTRPIGNSSGSDQTSRLSNQNSLSDIETDSFNLWESDNHQEIPMVYIPNPAPVGVYATNSVPNSSTLRPKNSNRVYLNGTFNPYHTHRHNSQLRPTRPVFCQNPYELFPIKAQSRAHLDSNLTSFTSTKNPFGNQNRSSSPAEANQKQVHFDSLNPRIRRLSDSLNHPEMNIFPWESSMNRSFDDRQSILMKDEDDSLLLADFDIVIDGKTDTGRSNKKAPIVVCKNSTLPKQKTLDENPSDLSHS